MKKSSLIMAAGLVLLFSCTEPIAIIPPQKSTQVKAVAILSDSQIDVSATDPSEAGNLYAEVIYSDGGREYEALPELMTDKTVFNTAGVKQVTLEKDDASTFCDIFVYDMTLSEMQARMTEIVASGNGAELQSFCSGKYVLVDEEALSKGPLTAVDDVMSYPAFLDTYFRGPAGMALCDFSGGVYAWQNMADISADGITFDNLNVKLTDLAGSEGNSLINGIYISGENARIINSSFSNGVVAEDKTFFGIYIETDAGKTEVSDVSLTGFDSALAVRSGAADIRNVTFDGIIAIYIESVDDFDSVSLSGCNTLNDDRTEVPHDVIVIGKDDVVGTDVEKANEWFERMKNLNPGLVFGRAKTLEIGGAEIEGWTPVDGGDVEAGL